jgi:hypothetical protein
MLLVGLVMLSPVQAMLPISARWGIKAFSERKLETAIQIPKRKHVHSNAKSQQEIDIST